MPGASRKYCVRFLVDLTLLVIVGLPILLFFLLGKPFERGFYCDDDSIRYPFKNSTISSGALYVVGTLLPLFSFFVIEFIHTRKAPASHRLEMCGRSIHPWLKATYVHVGVFLFGCACSQLTTDIAKYSVGRLRPHFIDVCKPDWSKINCTEGYYNDPTYCTAPDDHKMREARLSFPSGHASFSAFTMIYLVLYLHARLRISGMRLIKPVLQFICLMLTFYTALSRISDYKHHWSDVLFGFALGTVVAFLTGGYVAKFFSRKVTSVDTSNDLHMHQMGGNRNDGRVLA